MKKKMNLFAIAMLALSLSACSVDVKSDDPVVIPEKQQEGPVGPYTMAFTATNVYEHKFDIPILQNEGKVEYFTAVGEAGTLKIETFTSSVQGCEAAQTNVGLYWSADGGTTAMTYVKSGAVLNVASGKRGLLYVAFRGLTGCTRLVSNLKLTRTPPVPAPTFPDNLLGSWKGVESGSYGAAMTMTLTRAASGVVDVTYTHNCGAGYEAFQGVIQKSNVVSTPQSFSVKITKVTPFEGGCGNVFALDTPDVGRFVNCTGEKSSATATAFRLSCVLKSTPDVLPISFYEGDMTWIAY